MFASDAMSSVAYAPEEIFLTLSVAGASAYALSPWIGLAVVVVLLTVVTSYRQNVHAYPSGGGDYEVATVNLGRRAGLTVASALLVDYTLTVAVSISAAAANIGALVPFVAEHKVPFAVGAIVLLTAVNLRGIRESGAAFAVPVYAFMIGIGAMIVWGLVRILLLGQPVLAASANLTLLAEGDAFTGLALVLLILRSFTQGAAALTGVEAISNGVPAFQKPKSRNAATTLLLLGVLSVSMFMGLVALAQLAEVKIAEDPARQFADAPAGLRPADDGGPARRRRVLGVPAGLLLRGRDDGADPGAGRQHGVQRLPGARLDPRAGPLPAPPAAHPRRPARVLQRHPHPRRVRRGARGRLPGRGHAADPAVHGRCVRLVHAVADGHGAALEPAAAHRDRPDGARGGCAAPSRSTASARS